MRRKILAAIVSIAFIFGTGISTSCASYYDDDDDYEYYDDEYEDDEDYDDEDFYDDEDDDDEYYDDKSDQMLDGDGMTHFVGSQFAQEILDQVNQERARAGVAPLTLSEDLTYAADIRAEEIVENFSHTRPDGSSCFTVLDNNYRNVGENIAAGSSTSEGTMNQWMNSPGHRANILNPNFTELGVGYVYRDGSEYGHYWVQLFRRPMR
ncbi:MAG: hypothetical protein IJ575_12190 [Selenomonadaceae bacterium]|nr:hypothetical protein [Selenomonadaceae bacterium]